MTFWPWVLFRTLYPLYIVHAILLQYKASEIRGAKSDGCFSDGVVVIAGDLFEKEEDLQDDKIWKDAGQFTKRFIMMFLNNN